MPEITYKIWAHVSLQKHDPNCEGDEYEDIEVFEPIQVGPEFARYEQRTAATLAQLVNDTIEEMEI